MRQLLWTTLQAFGFAVVLTPIFRDIFRSYNVVDAPDQDRKVHVYPIPRVGGIAIALAYVLALFFAGPQGELRRELSLMSDLLPGAVLVFATGLIDDFFGLKPWQKLLGQIIAATLAFWAGVRILGVGGHPLPPIWSFPLTMGWLLLCTNAVNLVDGLDGLAAGVGLFATLTIFISALMEGNQPLAFATLPLAGCLLGFLCFNFNPATVFLGDCGSLLIGFLLGCFGVLWTQKSATMLGITAPLMALCIPLLDVGLCIVRRWLRDQPIFAADRGHIHHRLLDRGLTPRQAVMILYAFCGLAAAFSLVQSQVNNPYLSILVVVVFVALVWTGIHSLNYAEFMLATRLLRIGELKRGVHAQLTLSSFERALLGANSMDGCWAIITGVYRTFGFAGVRIIAGSFDASEWPGNHHAGQFWVMTLPVGDYGRLELAREFSSAVLPACAVPFAELVAEGVTRCLAREREAVAASDSSVVLQAGS
jgi:UDP-GlcNAc:undecaprenyl-phosphate GlcNAc-1-phosphate transferase